MFGQNLFHGDADGQFNQSTFDATKLFQTAKGLDPDGKVGNKTYGAAMLVGFNAVLDERKGMDGADWPPKPAFQPLVSNAQRQAVFGTFTFVPHPTADDPEEIRITDNWERG